MNKKGRQPPHCMPCFRPSFVVRVVLFKKGPARNLLIRKGHTIHELYVQDLLSAIIFILIFVAAAAAVVVIVSTVIATR